MGQPTRLYRATRGFLRSEPVGPERDANVIDLEVGVAGYFKLEAVKPDGTRRLLADWQKNLITDKGLELWASSNICSFCHVGTGSSTPAVTDTTMATWKAVNSGKVGDGFYTGSPYGTSGASPYYGWNRGTYRFSAGVATGNITEVGLGPSNTNTNISCRALVKDGAGNPTTISVLSDEMLDVTYEVRMYAPAGDSTYNITISGTVYTFTIRACAVTDGSAWGWPIVYGAGVGHGGTYGFNGQGSCYKASSLAAVTAAGPTGTLTGSSSSDSTDAYAAGTHQIDMTWTFNTSVVTDAAGVTGMLIRTTRGSYQVNISPTIPKNNTNNLSLKFRVSWARYP